MIQNIPIKKDSGRETEEILGLVVPGSCPADELEIYARAYRDAPSGAGQVMFVTDELDEDGEPTGRDVFDEVEGAMGKRPLEAQRWRRILGWPEGTRDPTPEDADAFLRAVNGEAHAQAWYAVKAHRDAAAAPPVSPTPPAARPPRPPQPRGFRMA